MRQSVSVTRLAKSAGLSPEDVLLALMERGVDIDDPEKRSRSAAWSIWAAPGRRGWRAATLVRVESPDAPDAGSSRPLR
jgi:hypothetical protein